MVTKHTTEKIHTPEHTEGSYRSYTIGFVLSLVFTLIPFWLFQTHALSGSHLLIVAVGSALVQLFVQLVLFLHLNFSSKSRTNLIVFIYAVVLVVSVVVGTLWIMANLKANMVDNVHPDGDYTPQSEAY